MLKSILSFCITGLVGLLIFVLLAPQQANSVAHEVLGGVVTVSKTGSDTLPISPISKAITSVIDSVANPEKQQSDPAPITDDPSAPFSVENIIDATNAERVKAGLTPLKTNTRLEQSAKRKVEDMIKNQYFEHTSPAGKTVADLGTEVGYDYVVMGENLALGNFNNAHDLLQAWMNSPGHRANILNASYEDVGVYAAQGTYQGRTVWFAVQHFGTERGVCPAVSTSLKSTITSLNAKIKQEESQISALRIQIEDPNHVQGQAYADLIAQFNALVVVYNADVTNAQQKISQYNKEVTDFNSCLSHYQVAKEE